MPIFEYRCDACGNEFEHLVLRNTPPAECPACAGTALTKLLSLTSVSSPERRNRNFRDQERRANLQREEIEHARDEDDHHHTH